MPNFYINLTLLETSLTVSAFVIQTFLITKSILAKGIYFTFNMATNIFKIAAKFVIFQQIKVIRDLISPTLHTLGQFFYWSKIVPWNLLNA